jgi:hypothetical protein
LTAQAGHAKRVRIGSEISKKDKKKEKEKKGTSRIRGEKTVSRENKR